MLGVAPEVTYLFRDTLETRFKSFRALSIRKRYYYYWNDGGQLYI